MSISCLFHFFGHLGHFFLLKERMNRSKFESRLYHYRQKYFGHFATVILGVWLCVLGHITGRFLLHMWSFCHIFYCNDTLFKVNRDT